MFTPYATNTSSNRYDESPETTGGFVSEFASSGLVNIVGGCCGTTPRHIHAIYNGVKGIKPRMPVRGKHLGKTMMSGLEPMVMKPG
jgi:5-methyltetrahydrofolate--homocysteine methyltransferase